MSLANIFQKPKNVIAFGNVYPVKLKDWEEFESNINPIILGKKHIQLNIKKIFLFLIGSFYLLNQMKTYWKQCVPSLISYRELIVFVL